MCDTSPGLYWLGLFLETDMEFVTTKQHRYRGKIQKVGDKYEIAGKSDARLVQALGWSIPAPVIVAPVAPVVVAKVPAPARVAYVSRIAAPAPVVIEPPAEPVAEVAAESIGDIEPVADTDKPKRAYKRRDLSAE
jgi:hypothetical protein